MLFTNKCPKKIQFLWFFLRIIFKNIMFGLVDITKKSSDMSEIEKKKLDLTANLIYLSKILKYIWKITKKFSNYYLSLRLFFLSLTHSVLLMSIDFSIVKHVKCWKCEKYTHISQSYIAHIIENFILVLGSVKLEGLLSNNESVKKIMMVEKGSVFVCGVCGWWWWS